MAQQARVYAPPTVSVQIARPWGTTEGVPLAGARLRTRRQTRSRRVEYAMGAMALVALSLGACALRPRVAPSPAGVAGVHQAAGAAGQPGPGGQLVGPPALAQSGPPVVATVAGAPLTFSFAKFEADPALVAGAAAAGVPSLSGESAIVVDVERREVLYAKNPHKRQLMASTAKIMTALVAAERASLEKVITVPAEATQIEPNHMGIRAGEKLTLRELLYGLMLDSGNDAAEAIAIGVGGGASGGTSVTAARAQFIGWMNEKAQQLGLQNTRFANPAGLDDKDAYSTAYDLAVLGAHALKVADLREIYGAKGFTITASKEPGREHGWFGPGNLNSLIGSYRGAIGIKPGYTEDAGYTLVAAAERDGRTLVAVTLNSRSHFSDATRLLDFGFARKPE
ncbi:MAG TPA: D-alanyl-D-alanine carboxypeptidase family protein [Chloroflexota bacterium]|nr:D-alanyl-D-alanine carboxypeptidase family protein [Chloroflexota bacterium]